MKIFIIVCLILLGYIAYLAFSTVETIVDLLKNNEKIKQAITRLTNDVDKLNQQGIQAIYDNAVYTSLKPGLLYVFKINNSGQLFPEIIPDI